MAAQVQEVFRGVAVSGIRLHDQMTADDVRRLDSLMHQLIVALEKHWRAWRPRDRPPGDGRTSALLQLVAGSSRA